MRAAIAVFVGVILALASWPAFGYVGTPIPGVIVISDDGGGGVDDHVKFYDRIAASGIPVRVEGICVSACTLVLALPRSQLCITPTASFGFHLANDGAPNANLTDVLQDRYYPKSVVAWIKEFLHGRPLTPSVIYMSYSEAIRVDAARSCDQVDASK
jgi:hypothetical protein